MTQARTNSTTGELEADEWNELLGWAGLQPPAMGEITVSTPPAAANDQDGSEDDEWARALARVKASQPNDEWSETLARIKAIHPDDDWARAVSRAKRASATR